MKTGKKSFNSTSESLKERIKGLFDGCIKSQSRHFAAKNDPLKLNIDYSCSTYYESPRHLPQLNFQLMDLEDARELSKYLTELWEGEVELLQMIPEIIVIAFALKEEDRDSSSDLDSFIYAMY